MGICIGFQSWLVPAHRGPIGLVFALDFSRGWFQPIEAQLGWYLQWISGMVGPCPSGSVLVIISLGLLKVFVLTRRGSIWLVFALLVLSC